MPGIYLHIPFCKQACHYCDFHFSTSLKSKDLLVNALIQEIDLRIDFFKVGNANPQIDTIYFGGGTPSLLTQDDLFRIFNALAKNFPIAPKAEITLEANPDDLTLTKLKELRQTPVNRLSIGVQSFQQEHLTYMNRAHNAYQGITSIIQSQEHGFENISIDLIYGFPDLSNEQWQKNLDTACSLNLPHISSYCMTVEPKTAMDSFIKKGKEKAMNEEQAAIQFDMLVKTLQNKTYQQYEISNFCKADRQSKHNSSYWKGQKYLGLGPSAHSYNLETRQWNVANNAVYIKEITEGRVPFQAETLSEQQRYNEYILTTLRTVWGSDLKHIEILGKHFLKHCLKEAAAYLNSNDLLLRENHLYLTEKGKLLADRIAGDLFWV